MTIDLTRARILQEIGPRPQYVYFILATGGNKNSIKIGVSHDPQTRMAGLSTASVLCPEWMHDAHHINLSLLGYIPGDVTLEHEIHDACKEHRDVGEWFHYSDLVDTINEILDSACVCVPCRFKQMRRNEAI